MPPVPTTRAPEPPSFISIAGQFHSQFNLNPGTRNNQRPGQAQLIDRLGQAVAKKAIANNLICPLSHEPLKDPVVVMRDIKLTRHDPIPRLKAGESYERSELEQRVSTRPRMFKFLSRSESKPLRQNDIVANHQLKDAIDYLNGLQNGELHIDKTPFDDPVLSRIQDPIILPCGHTFDAQTIRGIESSRARKCPLDPQPIPRRKIPNIRFKKLINHMRAQLPKRLNTNFSINDVKKMLTKTYGSKDALTLNGKTTGKPLANRVYGKAYGYALVDTIDRRLQRDFGGSDRITRHVVVRGHAHDQVNSKSSSSRLQALIWKVDGRPVIAIDLGNKRALPVNKGNEVEYLGGWYEKGAPDPQNNDVICLHNYTGAISIGDGGEKAGGCPPGLIKKADQPGEGASTELKASIQGILEALSSDEFHDRANEKYLEFAKIASVDRAYFSRTFADDQFETLRTGTQSCIEHSMIQLHDEFELPSIV